MNIHRAEWEGEAVGVEVIDAEVPEAGWVTVDLTGLIAACGPSDRSSVPGWFGWGVSGRTGRCTPWTIPRWGEPEAGNGGEKLPVEHTGAVVPFPTARKPERPRAAPGRRIPAEDIVVVGREALARRPVRADRAPEEAGQGLTVQELRQVARAAAPVRESPPWQKRLLLAMATLIFSWGVYPSIKRMTTRITVVPDTTDPRSMITSL